MTEAELDHIASGIRPSWELDDAPFRPGGLASPELEALLALGASGNGVAHTNGAAPFASQLESQLASPITAQRGMSANAEPDDLLTRVDPVPPAPVLEDAPIAPVRIEAAAAAPLPVPQFPAQAATRSNRPQAHVAPSQPPPRLEQTFQPAQNNGVAVSAQADPFAAPEKARPKAARAKSTSSADFPAIQKSNKGLYIALGGGAVAIVVVAAIAFTSSGSSASSGKGDTTTKVSASPTATQMPGTSTTHEIPPPPAADDLPAATAAATQAAPTAAPTTTTALELPVTTATTPPPATHVAHTDNPPAVAHHAASAPHTNPPANPPAGGGGGKGKGGIVRDVPF